MILTEAQREDRLEIISIADSRIRVQAFRFGISKGAYIKCYEQIPQGPVIIKKNLQEIAIGRKLAEGIEVRLV
ncbi:FeoA family protein [Sporohalobacter salinus]|uniref:FeoA family protein n=1 Tax=Sporohalobacter salinus TaxID=1494606 RepID=UPI001960DBB8|nr:ferrous iron transport protein A [Sporohalobacter salinus]MBM7622723.1 ferrous iron transport protein A [Sporohalobacter salinus]